MKQKLNVGLALVVLIVIMQPVLAQTNSQGLSWGVDIGDQFSYTWTIISQESSTSGTTTWSDDIIFEIIDLPNIPTAADSFIYLSDIIHTEMYFSNGTICTENTEWTAVPIGNWSLMEELLTEYSQSSGYDRLDFSLSSTTWKVEADYTDPDTFRTFNVTNEFSRQDGVISHVYVQQELDDSFLSQEMVRIDSPTSPASTIPFTNLLVLTAAVVGIGAVAIIIVYIRRR